MGGSWRLDHHVGLLAPNTWKQRLRTTRKNGPSGAPTTRVNYWECLTPVRAFYLDLAHLADHRKHTRELLQAAPQATLGTRIADGDNALQREGSNRGAPERIWVRDRCSGRRRDLTREEDHAFWAWALVEVLRGTGIRIEELGELSHHSLVEYQLPTTGEVIPLLQILPSKTDAERLLVISPTLADVLAAIINRASDHTGRVPLVSAYDRRERRWSSAAPLLFQRRAARRTAPWAQP